VVSAPATNILSPPQPATTRLTRLAGQASQATALTSGTVALLRAATPAERANVIERLIPPPRPRRGGRDDSFGFGEIQPYAALTAKVPASPPPLLSGGDRPPRRTQTPPTLNRCRSSRRRPTGPAERPDERASNRRPAGRRTTPASMLLLPRRRVAIGLALTLISTVATLLFRRASVAGPAARRTSGPRTSL